MDRIKERVGEKTLLRISKLLEMGKGGANENEASNAMRMALDLLAQHNLDASQVEFLAEEEDVESETLSSKTKKFTRWRDVLFNCISETHFCYLYRSGKGTSRARYILTGTPTNRQAAQMLFHYLESVIEGEARRAVMVYDGWDSKRTFGNAFRLGMVNRVCERLREQMRQIQGEALTKMEEQGSTEIVAFDPYERAKERNLHFIKSGGVQLKAGRSGRNNLGSGAGYHAGKAAGDKIGLTAGHALPRRAGC